MPKEEISCCVISSRIYVVGDSLSRYACREFIFHARKYVVELDLWNMIAHILRRDMVAWVFQWMGFLCKHKT